MPDKTMAAPPAIPKVGHLDSMPRLRREMARLYAEARQGRLPAQDASKLAHILSLMARLLELGELEQRLARVEARTATDGP